MCYRENTADMKLWIFGPIPPLNQTFQIQAKHEWGLLGLFSWEIGKIGNLILNLNLTDFFSHKMEKSVNIFFFINYVMPLLYFAIFFNAFVTFSWVSVLSPCAAFFCDSSEWLQTKSWCHSCHTITCKLHCFPLNWAVLLVSSSVVCLFIVNLLFFIRSSEFIKINLHCT